MTEARNVQLAHGQVRRELGKLPIRILLSDVADPLNVGSLFRLADALGVEKLHLAGSTPVPPDPKIKRTARAAAKAVEWRYHADAADAARALAAEGYSIVSLEITSASQDIRVLAANPPDKICLIVGAESEGVRQELLDLSDHTVHIPMRGQNSSMNVAAACAIAVSELTREWTA
jgi:tRNA G18 (ribose-2'-O)-methylase SpoU